MTTMLELTCRDPIVSRDGRPFGSGQGNRMRSAGWLPPSVVAGSLRSMLGKAANREFSVETARELLQVEIAGVFPETDGTLYLPAPQDCVVHPTRGPQQAIPHTVADGGCDWPVSELQPVTLTTEQATEDFKPLDAPAWWPVDRYAAWLANRDFTFDYRFLERAEVEYRTHVHLDPEVGSAEDSDLFTTAALPLTHLRRYGAQPDATHTIRFATITLAGRVRADDWSAEAAVALDTLHPLGGERRLVHWKATEDTGSWRCPQEVSASMTAAERVRMVLATPAVFSGGWKPGWIDDSLIGMPPGADVVLKLVGVSIQRWRAISGWSLANLPDQPRGPKPVKRVVPAGGVYFFEVVNGSAAGLVDRWLEPVSDNDQDQRDGFGLAIWGVW